MLDAVQIKKDFPILNIKYKKEKPITYLDSAATSQKPKIVIDAIQKYYTEQNANIHRGVYSLSQEATDLYEDTRKKLACFFGVSNQTKNFIFTKSATESINLVAQSYVKKILSVGDEILLTELEHHSNILPWQVIAKEKKAILKYIPIKEDYTICYDTFLKSITKKTKFVSISQMSNVTGTIHDIKQMIQKVREVGAKILVDGCQSACHIPVKLNQLDCDFFVFSAHKMLGPTGLGVLYGKTELLNQMDPYMSGGGMIEFVYKNETTYAQVPEKFEAGTPNIAGVVAFSKAIDYIEKIDIEKIYQHEKELLQYTLERFKKLKFIKIYGTQNLDTQGGIVSFNIHGVHPHDVGSILDNEGVAIRSGHHCAQIYMRSLGISGTNRLSFYLYNTKEDVDNLIFGIKRIKEIFSRVIHE